MVKGLTLLYQKSNYQVGYQTIRTRRSGLSGILRGLYPDRHRLPSYGKHASAEIALRKAVELSREQYFRRIGLAGNAAER